MAILPLPGSIVNRNKLGTAQIHADPGIRTVKNKRQERILRGSFQSTHLDFGSCKMTLSPAAKPL